MMSTENNHVSARFYQWQFVATFTWWVIVRILVHKNLYDITKGSVFTCPSWLSSRFLHRIQSPSNRKTIFLSALLALFIRGLSSSFPVRLVVAITISLYHLTESSVTHRHGEYPLLYNAWAMCLPSDYASAASWGIAIHFVVSTGIAKLLVGGTDWMDSSTMKFYLTVYSQAKQKASRPFLMSWNQWASRTNWATALISAMTIGMECGLVPCTLLMPANLRYMGTLGMVLMHIGIFLFMSKQVGIVFATTLPTYVMGFRCQASIGTGPWWLAVAVALLPNLLYRGSLPENWPLSPVSLFMWSGRQAKTIADVFMTQDTRVVMGTIDKTEKNIMGLPVLHHGVVAANSNSEGSVGSNSSTADQAVHDCVLRVIGFTLLHPQLKDAVPTLNHEKGGNIRPFLQSLELFLDKRRRMYETQSGQPLVKAFFVLIDDKGKVEKVLNLA